VLSSSSVPNLFRCSHSKSSRSRHSCNIFS
jgi:hypothetical protein